MRALAQKSKGSWLAFLLACPAIFWAQTATYSWSGYTSGATSYTTGIMVATVTLTSVNMQYSTPRYFSAASVGSGQCGQAGGLALECLFQNITSAAVTMKMDFTDQGNQNGTCASVRFIIKDINADESVQTFADWVEISAVDGNGTAVAAASIAITAGSNTSVTTSGTTKIIKGYSGSYGSRSSTACNTTTVTVTPPSGVPLKSITLKYHPDYTACASCYYNWTGPLRPAYQYISIGQLDATGTGGTGCTITLPIELTTFDVKCDQGKRTVEWQTASETNNDYFTVEGSNNGEDFMELVRVESQNHSNTAQHYSVTLPGSETTYSYYRLRQTDKNGESTVSKIIHSFCAGELQQIFLSPNPAQGSITALLENESDGIFEARILNVLGQTQKRFDLALGQGSNRLVFDVGDLPAGNYYIELARQDQRTNFKPARFVKE